LGEGCCNRDQSNYRKGIVSMKIRKPSFRNPLFIFLMLTLFVSCRKMRVPDEGKLLDMTFPYDETAIYWPTAKPFQLEKLSWGISEGGWWYASNNYSASEHGGTHADAPIHFAKDGRTIDKIPLAEWIGPAVKIDVTEKCQSDRDYLLTVEDIKSWESRYGIIPKHAWVIMYTGIDTRYYPDRKQVLGTDKEGAAAIPELSFPGFSPESVTYLLEECTITGIAIDTPSIDYGKSGDFRVHQILFAADKLALENIACLDKLPVTGAILYVIPMFIKDGTGAPARVFAIVP
jgi:kynurenine formamidase